MVIVEQIPFRAFRCVKCSTLIIKFLYYIEDNLRAGTLFIRAIFIPAVNTLVKHFRKIKQMQFRLWVGIGMKECRSLSARIDEIIFSAQHSLLRHSGVNKHFESFCRFVVAFVHQNLHETWSAHRQRQLISRTQCQLSADSNYSIC